MNKPNSLSAWKERNHRVLLDPDNVFWAVRRGSAKPAASVTRDILALHAKVKGRLDREMHDFRFGQGLNAVYIDPTDKCNANCPYCYIPAEIRRKGRSMTRAELTLVLENIRRYSREKRGKRKQVIIFHASEPLLVKDVIFEAIKKYQKIFAFGLQTNATLLERGDVKFLMKYKVGVGISLDSFSPETNNRSRASRETGGNFNQAVRAIEWFSGYPGLNVIATVTKFNVRHLPGMVEFLHAKKVPCVLFNPVRLTQPASRLIKPDPKVMTRFFLRAVDTALKLSKDSGRKIIIGNFSNTILAIIAPVARRMMCDISPCGGGRCFFTITAKGDMIPCGEFIGVPGFSGGNIFRTSISKAMASKAFKRIRSRVVEKIDECATCDLRNICGAPCPAEMHALGNMYQKSVFCDFYKAVIKYAFRLIAENQVPHLLRDGFSGNLQYEYHWKTGAK